MTIEELERHIEGCRQGINHSQRDIYHQFYGLGIHVCLRYANSREEAEEMCHDGFVRAFSSINHGLASFRKVLLIRESIWRKEQESGACGCMLYFFG